MSLVDLIKFLLVTAMVGAVVGGVIGLFMGDWAKGAHLGALLGPIGAGCLVTLVVFGLDVRNKLKGKKPEQGGGEVRR